MNVSSVVTIGNLEKNYGCVVGINKGTTKNGKPYFVYSLASEPAGNANNYLGFTVSTVFDWDCTDYGIRLGDHVLFAFTQGDYQRIVYCDVIRNPFEKDVKK